MTPEEYRRLVEALGLSVYGSAKVLGISQRTTRRYVSGDSPIPEPVAKLLRSMVASASAEQESRHAIVEMLTLAGTPARPPRA